MPLHAANCVCEFAIVFLKIAENVRCVFRTKNAIFYYCCHNRRLSGFFDVIDGEKSHRASVRNDSSHGVRYQLLLYVCAYERVNLIWCTIVQFDGSRYNYEFNYDF